MKINDHLSDILLTWKRNTVIIPKSFEHTLKWKPFSSKWASQISREERTGEDTLVPTPLYPTQHLWLMISLCELKICLSSILKCHTFQTLKQVLTNGCIGREQIKEKHMHTWLESLVQSNLSQSHMPIQQTRSLQTWWNQVECCFATPTSSSIWCGVRGQAGNGREEWSTEGQLKHEQFSLHFKS